MNQRTVGHLLAICICYNCYFTNSEKILPQPKLIEIFVKVRGPPALDSDDLEQHVQQHPCSSSRQLAAEFGVHQTTVLNYLHQLGFINKKGAEVPHALTQQQKHQRVVTCTELLARLSAGMQLSQLITCDFQKFFRRRLLAPPGPFS
ncbi:hypothetical protein niasHT_014528 [Heterodera trifolii]|uniref:Transposase n=1 Tax=Heterodera trifolii TaxID=157864 RepID=A0ABD2L3C5_9BILA